LRGAGYEALFGLLASTGLRVSEAIHLRDGGDVDLRVGMLTVRRTKFAKSRQVPLHPSTIKALSRYRRLRSVYIERDADAPFFVGTRGKRLGHALRDGKMMSRSNVKQRLRLGVARAAELHPSLLKRRVSPHTIRHTTAMHLLQSGVAFSVIALWLGHESATTTHRYVEADLAMKEKALARLQPPNANGIATAHPIRPCSFCKRYNYAQFFAGSKAPLQRGRRPFTLYNCT
jgi:integrase